MPQPTVEEDRRAGRNANRYRALGKTLSVRDGDAQVGNKMSERVFHWIDYALTSKKW